MRYAVLADPHINISFPFAKRIRQWKQALAYIAFQENIDGVIICGDVSDHGLTTQLESFAYTIQDFKQKSKKEALVVLGNHDLNHYLPMKLSVLETMNEVRFSMKESKKARMYEERMYQNQVFLLMNSEARLQTDAYVSQAQITWLEERLQAHRHASCVCVIHHHPLTYTHKRSEHYGVGKQEQQIKAVLVNFDNVVWISGHLHNNPSDIQPTSNQFGLQIDVPSFQLTKWHGGHNGCGLLLDIEDGFIKLQVFDFLKLKAYQTYVIDLLTKQSKRIENVDPSIILSQSML